MLVRVIHACAVVSALIMGAILLMVCFDVISRNMGGMRLPWIVEVTEYSLPVATLLTAPWLLYRNEHVRLDLLQAKLSAPAMRRVDRLAAGIGLIICLIICWYSVRVIMDAVQVGGVVLKSLVFPEWWLFVPVPVGFGLMAVVCVRKLQNPDVHLPANPLDAVAGD